MVAPVPFGETLTRLRLPDPDRYGETGPPVEVDVSGCVVWPIDGNGSSGNEDNEFRNTVTYGYAVMLPPDTDAAPADRWRWHGDVFEQLGEAGRYRNPFTGTAVLTIAIRRVTG